jgi:transcription-repair coupling factor (superfamily II helicase)
VHDFVAKSPFFHFLKKTLQEKPSFCFFCDRLWDTPKALLLAFVQEITQKHLLFITSSEPSSLLQDLSFFTKKDPLEFPALPSQQEGMSPSPEIVGQRLKVLHLLLQKEKNVLISQLPALLGKLPKKETIEKKSYLLKKGEALPFSELSDLLSCMGYVRSSLVSDKGFFALRGGILDIFPPSALSPYRIEFFGDQIESIRTFDAGNQKSMQKIDQFSLLAATEESFDIQTDSSSLFDYLKNDCILVYDDLLAMEDLWASNLAKMEKKTPWNFSWEEVRKKMNEFPSFYFNKEALETLLPSSIRKRENAFLEPLSLDLFSEKIPGQRLLHPFVPLDLFIHSLLPEKEEISPLEDLFSFAKEKIDLIFFSDNEHQEREIKAKIEQKHLFLPENTTFARGYLSSGVVLRDIPLVLLPYSVLSHRKKLLRPKQRESTHVPLSEFHELAPGDLVVHFHSGIGKFLGIEKQKNHLGKEEEFLVIEYAENSKLFVPLSQSHLVSRYIGSHEEKPILSTLGSQKWLKTKVIAQREIMGYASELLQLYAERSLSKGFSLPPDSEEIQLFEMDFPYQETSDQLQAIADIKSDFAKEKPMDRLICGDVGYGKTEVALRAAFKMVVDGKKQVAILVPTTLLAQQHFETFQERIEGFRVTVEVLSRFRTPKQNRETLEKVKEGQVDILIGTHRILSQDVQFKDLGLLIVDEEQRFGVRAKEHLKKRKSGVACLTLSATPIPRTLYMSLVHARDMSVINTPPQDRLPIKSIIAFSENHLIEQAILRELTRKGQVFFIHNHIETLFRRAEEIQKLVPSARIAIVHGQMSSDRIDEIFHEFKNYQHDILFATTIIENGIDIPNANTILVDKADTYGLADLYQLRGRVGRWNKEAFAYFLVRSKKELSDVAQKRLHALVEAGGYGGGIKIAMRDLEIRGAGNILGVEQSGQISAIGFHLYCKLLKKAVDSLRSKREILFTETKIEIPIPALLPENYIPETSLRLELYHRLGSSVNFAEIDALYQEICDRFGKPPREVEFLYHLSKVRLFASYNGFTTIKWNGKEILFEQTLKGKTMEKRIPLLKANLAPQEFESFLLQKMKENFPISWT